MNFYSFRKIKYGDSIRIDLETEKRTANYWRFKHENFRQGRPDLLSDIKRMNGKNAVVDSSNTLASNNPSVVPPSVLSSTTTKLVPNHVSSSTASGSTLQVAEKSEVLKLKKRIDEMTKNIDKLTEMVQKVTLHQQNGEDLMDQSIAQPGSKRKKTPQQEAFSPNEATSSDVAFPDLPMPDEAFSTSIMDIDELMSPDKVSSASEFLQVPPPAPLNRESSSTTDSDFVDQLFTAFNDDDDINDYFTCQNKSTESFYATMNAPDEFAVSTTGPTKNRPNPELMRRLSDALQLLPRDIQELIVNRLIDAITSSEGFTVPPIIESETTSTISSTRTAPSVVISTPKPVDTEQQPKKATYIASSKSLPEQQQQVQPLAAATLAALLHHYSSQIIVGSQQQQDDTAVSESKKNIKTLPVIQVHA